jgi:hypothetical protein
MTYKHNIVNYKIVNYNKSQAKRRLVSSSRPFWHSPPSIANPWIEDSTSILQRGRSSSRGREAA